MGLLLENDGIRYAFLTCYAAVLFVLCVYGLHRFEYVLRACNNLQYPSRCGDGWETIFIFTISNPQYI